MESNRIRTSHPSGSRHWGCFSRRSLPAPGSFEPQKIVSTLFCPSGRPLVTRPFHRSISRDVFRNGEWRLCDRSGWPDNQSCQNILAWCWVRGGECCLIVVNFSAGSCQALVRVPVDELRGRSWRLDDRFSGETIERSGNDMRDAGMYIDLRPWRYHFFRLYPS